MTESREESRQKESERPAPPKDWQGEEESKEAMYPASHPDSLPKVTPGVGGYDDRDPAEEMPRSPGFPETQDEE